MASSSSFPLSLSLCLPFTCVLSFFHFPICPCCTPPFSSLNSIHPLSRLLLSSPLWPSPPLLAQALHCFDIWPNYLANWGSCSCHTVWRWGSISCCLYNVYEGHGQRDCLPNILSFCSVWVTGKGTITAWTHKWMSFESLHIDYRES